MTVVWLAFHNTPSLTLALSPFGYVITLLYAVLAFGVLARSLADFGRFSARHWLLFALCLGAAPLLARMLVVSSAIPGIPAEVALPPLIFLPLLAAALWLGRGPATLVGLLTGLAWTLFDTGRLTQPFEIALLGAALAASFRQTYRGMLARLLRQPLVSAPLAALAIAWPLGLLGIFATGHASPLTSLERAVTLAWPTLIWCLGSALAGGILFQLALAAWPRLRPVHAAELIPSPWERHLSQRLLYVFVPVAALATLLLIGVAIGSAYRLATRLVVDQMVHDATTASSQIPFFFQLGRELIGNLAQEEQLSPRLADDLRENSFFQEVLAFDAGQNLLAAYPGTAAASSLREEEAAQLNAVLQGGDLAEVTSYGEAEQSGWISFIAPVADPQTGEIAGALVGRTELAASPILGSVGEALHADANQTGEGFIVDEQGRILLHPTHPEQHGRVFDRTSMSSVRSAAHEQVFRQQREDGTRQLVYLHPVEGRPDWTVIMAAPDEVALALATQIALPMMLLLVAVTTIALAAAITLTRNVTAPLEVLAQAADRIAEGQLDHAPDIGGEDEIGRLGRAFEQMRARLARRIDEQERLLNVSRGVSSSLELFRAMPPILNSALDVTHAAGVRIVLQRAPGHSLQVYTAGPAASAMSVLDRQLLDLVEQQGTVVISQLWRASGSLDAGNLQTHIQALVALPLRSETSFHGILWLGYEAEHIFEQPELDFLSTLAGQAAVAVANARLFAEAEEERRKLEAVLESTADGMIVVDNEGRVVLVNPAAGYFFDIRVEQAAGRSAAEVVDVPELASLMTSLQEPVSVLELPHRNGKTLLANTSTIVGQDGAISGRVTVLRDITALKELDNIKTVFLRMVSHDLRSPLTYMRGYASMLPLSGNLNQKQTEAVDRIHIGIDHITQMTERLTYLSRLQFGEEAELQIALVDVEEIARKVLDQQESLARQKNITCRVEMQEKLPLLLVDAMLYEQAAANLVQNALKYTPEGGQVIVRAYVVDANSLTLAVEDNGIGIRLEDQARLFEAFYRVPHREGEPRPPTGSGLGLALVRAIAEAHGGTVGVQSEFGKGSLFTMTVPLRSVGE